MGDEQSSEKVRPRLIHLSVRLRAVSTHSRAAAPTSIRRSIRREKEQEHRSAIASHPDLNNPVDLVQSTLQPLGRIGAVSAPQIPPAADTAAKSGLPLILATHKSLEVPSTPGMQANPGRSLIQKGPTSPPYFLEFEHSSIYRFFDTRFTATPDELTALKLQMPDGIARHMIDGFIGPGPFAQEPIQLDPVGRIPDEIFELNDMLGCGFGCHKCGTLDPQTANKHFILDHQLPIGLNFGDWTFGFCPHCEACMWKQGGHVRVIRYRLKKARFTP